MTGQVAATLRDELEQLLAETTESAELRARTTFDQAIAERPQLVLFGTGNFGRRVLDCLRADQLAPVAFADNNSSLWGSFIEGLPVLSPSEAVRRFGPDGTFIVSIYNHAHFFPQTRNQLASLGAKSITSAIALRWKYHANFLPYFRDDLPQKLLADRDEILRGFDLWADDASRKEYVAQIRWRLHGDFDVLPQPAFNNQYFADDLVHLSGDEFFVDGGAFDGDTLISFLAQTGAKFDRYVALEPDPENFRRLSHQIDNLPEQLRARIDARQRAVWRSSTSLRFAADHSEAAMVSEEGSITVDCVSLDDLLCGLNPTYIKLDIEGAELDALEGGKTIIATARPRLAVCSYHRPDHLWKVPQTINRLLPRGSLFLRTHMYEAWESVCYAIPQ